MAFSLIGLRAIADSESYRRGRDYFSSGEVRNLATQSISPSQIKITGKVHGSRVYQVSLEIDPIDNIVINYACSCPYNWGGACKHVVALGLAYLDRPDENLSDGSNSALDIMQKFFREHHVKVNRSSLQDLASKLSFAASPIRPTLPKPKTPIYREHTLDQIRITLSYEDKNDLLQVVAEALYGPHTIPLCSMKAPDEGEEPEENGRRIIYHIQRDWQAEQRCLSKLRHFIHDSSEDQHELMLTGQEIYFFVKHILPDLQFEYQIEIDPSARQLVDIAQEDVTSDWRASSSGIDFLHFEVKWHCANTHLTFKQLEKMVKDGNPYLRREDGSFVELANPEEIKNWLEFLQGTERSKQNKQFTTRLFRLPEIIHLLERTKQSRLSNMDQHIQSFLSEAQMGKPIEPVILPKRLAGILRPYQKRGVEWGMFLQKYHFGGILADDMGLGKTLQTLALLVCTKQQTKKSQPSIVICPKTLIDIWAAEAAKFTPELRILTIAGTAQEREVKQAEISKADLVITSYPLILRDIQLYQKKKQIFRYCILDEAQAIKNQAASTTQAVKMVQAEYRLALSGTPLENGVHELWSIFDFLMPGFLGSLEIFRRRFQRPIEERKDTEALTELKAKIQPFILRRTKTSELKDLPPKIEQTRICELTPEQLVLYTQTMQAVKRDVFAVVERKGFKHAHIEILAALLRLRQICNHPSLVLKTGKHDPHLSGKMPHALEIIQEAIAGGHKILLFSSFTSMLDLIRPMLDEHHIGHCTIEGKTQNRAEQVKRFYKDPTAQV
ncbi:hypothetical protein EXS71_03180, partial [Candidatus Uhrbacteria bacterium]|nr:hypothetical protein [Candidatus Uhrbacteria bacterium]